MTVESVRKVFTDWAPIYNATHAWTLPKRHAARLALDLRPGDRVLDLACGTGLNFPHLRQLVGATGQVIGADLTPAMLDIAQKVITEHRWKNVSVREADAAALPFPDASFDKVFCAFALNIIPEYVRAIEEAWRVLVPGGRFVSLEMESKMHSLPGWLQPVPHICAVDMSHHTLGELRRVFPGIQVRKYWMGTIFLAAAAKT